MIDSSSPGRPMIPSSRQHPSVGTLAEARRQLARCYVAALQAVDGRAAVRAALRARPCSGLWRVIAVGKAATAMTLGALDAAGADCRGGLVIDKAPLDPRPLSAQGIEYLIGGHPLPTAASLAAGERLLATLAAMPSDTALLVLLSGGASALVEYPIPGLGLSELEQANAWLLASGLPIGPMNRVRTALSRIKGGGLLAVLPPGPLQVLAISDVPGDDPAVIGSGPLVPALALVEGLAALDLPPWLRAWVERGLVARPTLPASGPPIELIATNAGARAAAAATARAAGFAVQVHETPLAGDAAARGRELARRLRDGPPGLQVWGGETTVRLPPAPGRGGRNQHLALAAALELSGSTDCLLLAAGTDGSDGPGDDAGALVDGYSIARAAAAGQDGVDCLARADSGTLLAASGDLIHTGPTGTNVMDLVLGLKLLRG